MTYWRIQFPQQNCPHCGKLVWQTFTGNVRIQPRRKREKRGGARAVYSGAGPEQTQEQIPDSNGPAAAKPATLSKELSPTVPLSPEVKP